MSARRQNRPPSVASKDFSRLQRGLTGGRGLIGSSYLEDDGMLRAYLAYYWPISRAQAQHALAVTAALEEMRGRASLPPRRVVDAGSVQGRSPPPSPTRAPFLSYSSTKASVPSSSRARGCPSGEPTRLRSTR
jgi:hypothetical protein